MVRRLAHILPATLALLAISVGSWVAVRAWQESVALAAYQQAISEVEVISPKGEPAQDQESIETALTMYSIQVPETVDGPIFDMGLADRGLTTGGLILPQKKVSVGPAAFTSWAVLGSTLAHEIEVHVPQSFFKVVAQDHLVHWSFLARSSLGRFITALKPTAKEAFENDGTWKAERDAYMHEIKNAKRFGLSADELRSIWRVMDYYYPNAKSAHETQLSASSELANEEPSVRSADIKASDL
ncbi:hypothetical protein EBU99_05245 [bacterium]|nr:hypothetical protein [bacterium]